VRKNEPNFESELVYEKSREQTLVGYMETAKGDEEDRRSLEGKLADTRRRIAELEANPPTPEETLAWLKATEEDYIDRRNEIRTDDEFPERAELLGRMDADRAAIREEISKLEPAQTKSQKFPLERMRCYVGGPKGKYELFLRAIWSVENGRVRYRDYKFDTGEGIGTGECSVKTFSHVGDPPSDAKGNRSPPPTTQVCGGARGNPQEAAFSLVHQRTVHQAALENDCALRLSERPAGRHSHWHLSQFQSRRLQRRQGRIALWRNSVERAFPHQSRRDEGADDLRGQSRLQHPAGVGQ
jgi:hypothetical protein